MKNKKTTQGRVWILKQRNYPAKSNNTKKQQKNSKQTKENTI
jgi:hypothetical protein